MILKATLKRGTEYEGVGLIYLALDRVQLHLRALVSNVMNRGVQ